jgi:predicted DsbA family dithiol-disulfide isomerase
MDLFTSHTRPCQPSFFRDWHSPNRSKAELTWRLARRSRKARITAAVGRCKSQPFSIIVCLFLPAVVLILVVAAMARGQESESLATVNGRSITRDKVERLVIAQTLPLEQKLYAIRKAALENLITFSVLEGEAEKRSITVAELRKQLAAGEVQVTPAQVEDAYATNASFFGSMSPDEAKERLRLDLENQQRMQNYRTSLAILKESARITLFLTEPRLPAVSDDATAPSLGPKSAMVTIVEYSDFECHYCRAVYSTLKQVLKLYENHVRLVFKHLPLEIHQLAFPAAQAAFCAGQQGLFWQYHDALFTSETLRSESFAKIAEDLRLNLPQFNRCLTSAASRNAVSLNIREASRLGINSTPTFIFNRKLVSGALNFEEFKAIIEQELSSARNSQNQQPQPARKD